MTPQCQWIAPDKTANDAAKIMKEQDFGFLPVGENDRLIGMVTDRDIVMRTLAEARDPQATQVRDIMTPKTYYCYDDQNVEDVCNNMGEIQVRRLPVVNRDKRLVGIVSLGDLAQGASRANVGQTEQQITVQNAQRQAAA
ncbi:MAG: CBS domain-containing protein [Alphaproteobacteria bacterium]|nr:CBS domain-containing protein [Alphaproteobacteria bacterium]